MIRFALVTLAAATLASGAQAGHCAMSKASGLGVSKEIATAMSTKALSEMIAKNGEKGKGKITTTCDGTAIVSTTCTSSQRSCK